MKAISLTPIGILHTPFLVREGIPRQAAGAPDLFATIEVFPAYTAGLTDLEGFSHIVVLFYMHMIESVNLTAYPPWDDKPHGVFSTCSPFRPNRIGMSVAKLEKIEHNKLTIRGVDMADGSPVLDIKPYIPALYPQKNICLGWMTGRMDGMIQSKTGDL